MDRRAKRLAGLALIGCVGAGCAAVGGSGTIIGGLLCLLSILLFSLLYEAGHLGPKLPPVRVPRHVLTAVTWTVVVVLLVLIVLALVRSLPLDRQLW